MMLLPETTRTDSGFTVEGASAALLEELLDSYAYQLKVRSRAIYDGLQPGLPVSQIEDALADVGILPPAELVVWWHWRNGFPAGFPHGLKHGQIQLDDAVGFYRRASLGTSIDQWNPDWIRIAGTGNAGDAMCCAEVSGPPLVRAVSTFDLGTQAYEEPLRQAVSLCTPVTWWLLAMAKGWDEWSPITGYWGWDETKYPLEWKITNLM